MRKLKAKNVIRILHSSFIILHFPLRGIRGGLIFNSVKRDNDEDAILHPKLDIPISKRETIEAVWVVVILRTRVLSENTTKAIRLILSHKSRQILRNNHFERMPFLSISEATPRFGMRIDIRNIRLDVKNRRAIHQVCTKNMNDGSIRSLIVDMRNADT